MKKTITAILFFSLTFFSTAQFAEAKSSCLRISKWYPSEVLKGAESGVGKLQYISAAAVKSPDFNKVHFVSIAFKAKGVGTQVGVWAVSGKLPQKASDLSGLTLAIDSIAQQFTVWPDGDRTSAEIAKNDRSVSTAKACLKK
ncbi:MAG: hypothetical protein RL733_1037 [Actinomycetota bacterium]|jgi:hypothetical protein